MQHLFSNKRSSNSSSSFSDSRVNPCGDSDTIIKHKKRSIADSPFIVSVCGGIVAEFWDNKKSWTLAAKTDQRPPMVDSWLKLLYFLFVLLILLPLSLGHSSREERPLILALSFICHCHTKGNCGRWFLAREEEDA